MQSDPESLKIYCPGTDTSSEIPLAESTVHAGFPSPADDFLEGSLDLNSLVIKHPEATFFARVEGDSMKDEGITEGDILVVDKAIESYDGCLAIAYIDGEFTLKRVAWSPTVFCSCRPIRNIRLLRSSPDRILGLGRGKVGHQTSLTPCTGCATATTFMLCANGYSTRRSKAVPSSYCRTTMAASSPVTSSYMIILPLNEE